MDLTTIGMVKTCQELELLVDSIALARDEFAMNNRNYPAILVIHYTGFNKLVGHYAFYLFDPDQIRDPMFMGMQVVRTRDIGENQFFVA